MGPLTGPTASSQSVHSPPNAAVMFGPSRATQRTPAALLLLPSETRARSQTCAAPCGGAGAQRSPDPDNERGLGARGVGNLGPNSEGGVDKALAGVGIAELGVGRTSARSAPCDQSLMLRSSTNVLPNPSSARSMSAEIGAAPPSDFTFPPPLSNLSRTSLELCSVLRPLRESVLERGVPVPNTVSESDALRAPACYCNSGTAS